MSVTLHAYRPDIDGLRALAVVSVLLFHAFPQWLPGGFVGVDVFFVISGYLITGIILHEAQRSQFTVRGFYARRIRRIFPALVLILAFVLGAGWLLLSPSEYTLLDKHVRSSAGFTANFRYLKEALAYFDPSVHSKLLLHVWSLAIEEQFYVVWPLLVVLALRLGRQRPQFALGLLAGGIVVASFAYNVWLLPQAPSAAFYLPHARAWELLIGGALAIWQARAQAAPLAPALAQAASALGLLLIGIALFAYDGDTAFPGAAALLPTLGTALVIAAGPHTLLNRHLLSNRAAVGVGLISYPLYLWHWPLLALAHICNAGQTSPEARAGLLVASLVLAWLTYVLLETPIRRTRRSALAVGALLAAMIALIPLSMSIKQNQGYPDRPITRLINGDVRSIVLGEDRDRLFGHCGLSPEQQPRYEKCLSGTESAPVNLVIGDSKAEALYYGLARESADRQWSLIGSVGLPGNPDDDRGTQAFDLALNAESVRTVVMVNALRELFTVEGGNGFIADPRPHIEPQRYDDLLLRLQQAGKQVVIVLDNPTLPDPTECIEGQLSTLPLLKHLLYRRINPHCNLRYTDQLAGTRAYRDYFAALKARHPQVMIVDLSGLLCDQEQDLCPYVEDDQFLYSYSDHLSDTANSRAARYILHLLQAGNPH